MNKYYENPELWGRVELTQLHKQVLSLINNVIDYDKDIKTIADVGCGDGIIINELVNKIEFNKAVGIDSSEEALSHVDSKVDKLKLSADDIHLENDCIDFVYCVDVLEHLPVNILRASIDEIIRISKNYVFLVTPFMESDAIKTQCTHCECVFNPYYHVNKFDLDTWNELLEEYKAEYNIIFIPMGEERPIIPRGLGIPMVSIGSSAYHSHKTVCPQCGMSFVNTKVSQEQISLLFNSILEKDIPRGNTYEEMGVLLIKKQKIENKLVEDIKNSNMKHFIKRSKYNSINLEYSNVLKNNIELFPSYPYILCTDHISMENKKVKWRLCEKKDNIITAILPLSKNQKILRLKITVNSEYDIKLFVEQVNLTGNNERLEFSVDSRSDRFEIPVVLHQKSTDLTPYGLIINITAISPQDSILNILSIEDEGEDGEEYEYFDLGEANDFGFVFMKELFDFRYIYQNEKFLSMPDWEYLYRYNKKHIDVMKYTLEKFHMNIIQMDSFVNEISELRLKLNDLNSSKKLEIFKLETELNNLSIQKKIEIEELEKKYNQEIFTIESDLEKANEKLTKIQEYMSNIKIKEVIELYFNKGKGVIR